jgi:hypothetical protein
MPDRVFARATDVQATLTRRGQHRSAGAVDLLVAAAAELSKLTLVHYDRDFDQITQATDQSAVWLAPAGSSESGNYPTAGGRRGRRRQRETPEAWVRPAPYLHGLTDHAGPGHAGPAAVGPGPAWTQSGPPSSFRLR